MSGMCEMAMATERHGDLETRRRGKQVLVLVLVSGDRDRGRSRD